MGTGGKWPYKSLPIKPEIYRELQNLKKEAQKNLGAKFDWSSFLWGLLVGAGGTAAGVVVAKAVEKWREERQQQK